MLVKRIDLFMPYYSQYDVLHHFTIKLYEALIRTGVDCRLLKGEKYNPRPFLNQLFDNPPDCTLSFNGLLPDEEDRFFCDLIKMPHVCCLFDSPTLFFPLIKSPYNIITCVDQNATDFFRSLGHKNTLFMPHAVEKNLAYNPDEKRPYDVMLLGSSLDYQAIGESWKKKYPKVLSGALFKAAEKALAEEVFYVNAVVEAVNEATQSQMKIENLDMISLLDEFEMYVRGKDRVHLLKSLRDVHIAIVGQSKEQWERDLGKGSNFSFLGQVPFDQALQLMGQTKILLNSCAWILAGGHERIYTGMAAGAVVVTQENSYLKETFQDEENILFYRPQTLSSLSQKITSLLSNEPKRTAMMHKGRETVLHHDTWDHRASTLVKQLGPIIENMTALKE